MSSALPSNDGLYEAALRQGQLKHALKTALACCLAAGLTYYCHVLVEQLAPVFAYLILTTGMPRPRLNWLGTQLAVVASAIVSALILLAFRDVIYLYLAVTLLWIVACMSLSERFPLPATLGAMVSALGIFEFFQGTVGAALWFYLFYALNMLIAGFAIVVVHTLLWPLNAQGVFMVRLGAVYALLKDYCRCAARRLRTGESTGTEVFPDAAWAPFRPLRRLLTPELGKARDPQEGAPSNPFARMILACRSLNLRLWFFNRVIVPAAPAALPAAARGQMANLLDRCAEHFHSLLEGALQRKPVRPVDSSLLVEAASARWEAGPVESAAQAERPTVEGVEGKADVLLARGIHATILRWLVEDIELATAAHNRLLASFGKGAAGQAAELWRAATGARLLTARSLRSGAKLIVILVLLLLEQGLLGFPGGTQVAFYATFFASTGNLGRQNKTDLVGMFGLLSGFAYGVVAAYLTSHLPSFLLLLMLLFLGEFLASLAFQKLPHYGVAGVQAGLAIPFAYLATTGPAWGSFSAVQTRFWGLVVAGSTAVVVHAFLWPVLPTRQLRASIAAALRATAVSLEQLFAGPRAAWSGAPPSLGDTVTQAGDLLDDARYLPGPDRADPAYHGVLGCLQEIDANLEFIQFLIGLEEEHPLRQRFFQVIGDYAEQAGSNLEWVASQFQPSPSRAAVMEAVHWRPDASGRWESVPQDIGPVSDRQIDPRRPAVMARCLDQIARAVETISSIAREINLGKPAR